jgi:hypothetical protein
VQVGSYQLIGSNLTSNNYDGQDNDTSISLDFEVVFTDNYNSTSASGNNFTSVVHYTNE